MFLKVKMIFFGPKMMVTAISVNLIDLVISFLWSCSTPQSEFSIKSYGHLKLRLSDFDFFSIWSLLSFFFFSLSPSLFLYMKIDEKGLAIHRISVFEFWFLDRWIGMNERWDGYPWEQMLLVRWDILDFFAHEPLLTVIY
jgi:hypothetical protein